MTHQFPLNVEAGDPADILGSPYLFSRVDPDGSIVYRAPHKAPYGDFKVPDENGFPRYPLGNEMAELMRLGKLVFRGRPLQSEARRIARGKELDAGQVRAMDPMAEFRAAILRRYDATPWGLSDRSLRAFVVEALLDPDIAAMVERIAAILLQRDRVKRDVEAGRSEWRKAQARRKRIAQGLAPLIEDAPMTDAPAGPESALIPWDGNVPPSTLRDWLKNRGRPGERKTRDGLDMRGRPRRTKKMRHPLEIGFYHATRAASTRSDTQKKYDNYVAELHDINAGIPLNRFLLEDPTAEGDERGKLSDVRAEYLKPNNPYGAISYTTFWRLRNELRNPATYAAATSARAAESRYGGGGRSEEPTHLGAMCWMDDTPVPVLFLVDDDTHIPIGLTSLLLMRESVSLVAIGWDLAIGGPSSSAVLRVIRHANMPKEVPEHLLAIDPGLTWIRCRPDVIGFDNTLAAHGRSVEDVLNDAYIGVRYAGKEKARDKAGMERMIGIFQDLLFKQMPDANFDIERMRRYGFDPDVHVLCGVRKARELLNLAAHTLNLQRCRSLDNKQRALVWKQKLGARKLNKIEDLDQFDKSSGRVVDDVTMTNAGIEILNRRYVPGYQSMKTVITDFEAARRSPKNDISPVQKRRSNDDSRRLSFKVRIKYDEENIGRIHVWNPHAQPEGQWITFECADHAAHGMPLWLHRACLDFARQEALEYMTPEQQSVVRARLFAEIANTTDAAPERERRLLGRVMADKRTRAVLGQWVEVTDEPEPEVSDLPSAPDDSVSSTMSGATRKDTATSLPRNRSRQDPEPATLSKRDPAAPPPRHGKRGPNSTKSDRRDQRSSTKSAERPDQGAQRRARSNRLKWDDTI